MERNTLAQALPQGRGGELRKWTPGLMDNLRFYTSKALAPLFGGDVRAANAYYRDKIQPTAEYLPGVGDLMAAGEAKDAFSQGEYGKAAVDAGAAAVGLVPGVGDILAGAGKAIFAGIGAATANKALLKKAEEMVSAGASRDDIWRETGWFQGVDGKWRFEVDDSGTQYDPMQLEKGAGRYHAGPMREALTHNNLYAAYPDVGEVKHVFYTDKNRGVDGKYSPESPIMDERIAGWASDKSTALHELQHAVQNREGFARGSNLEVERPAYDAIAKIRQERADIWSAASEGARLGMDPLEAVSVAAEANGASPETWRRLFVEYDGLDGLAESIRNLDNQLLEQNPLNRYRRSSGEVEARNVQSRMDMTPDQRRATPPWATQDVPDENQIVRLK